MCKKLMTGGVLRCTDDFSVVTSRGLSCWMTVNQCVLGFKHRKTLVFTIIEQKITVTKSKLPLCDVLLLHDTLQMTC